MVFVELSWYSLIVYVRLVPGGLELQVAGSRACCDSARVSFLSVKEALSVSRSCRPRP